MIPETRRERAGWCVAFAASIVLFLSLFAAILPGCVTTRHLPPVNPLVVQESKSVVQIVGEHGKGSGFVVGCMESQEEPGKWRILVLTAGHCLDMGWPVHAPRVGGKDEAGVATRKWKCGFTDLGMIEFLSPVPLPVLKIRSESLRLGEHLWEIGFSLGEQAQVTQGVVGDPSQKPEFPIGDEDGMIVEYGIVPVMLFGLPGNSGSPAFDDNGEVVGVHTIGWMGTPLCGIVATANPNVAFWIETVLKLDWPYWLPLDRCGNHGH